MINIQLIWICQFHYSLSLLLLLVNQIALDQNSLDRDIPHAKKGLENVKSANINSESDQHMNFDSGMISL